jgi:hypothetical protein
MLFVQATCGTGASRLRCDGDSALPLQHGVYSGTHFKADSQLVGFVAVVSMFFTASYRACKNKYRMTS